MVPENPSGSAGCELSDQFGTNKHSKSLFFLVLMLVFSFSAKHNGVELIAPPPSTCPSFVRVGVFLSCLFTACPASPPNLIPLAGLPTHNPSASLTEGNPKVMLIGWDSVENAAVISPGIRRTIAFSGTPSGAIKEKLQQNNSFGESSPPFFCLHTTDFVVLRLCIDPFSK